MARKNTAQKSFRRAVLRKFPKAFCFRRPGAEWFVRYEVRFAPRMKTFIRRSSAPLAWWAAAQKLKLK